MLLDERVTQLFFSVVPAFIAALPPSPKHRPATDYSRQPQPEERNGETQDNAVRLLRFAVQQLLGVFTTNRSLYDLPVDAFGKASEALEDILFVLEELVDDEILDQEHNVAVLPKLQTFATILHFYHPTPIICGTLQFVDDCLRWVNYSAYNGLPEDCSEIANQMLLFNETMMRIYEAPTTAAGLESDDAEGMQIYQHTHHIRDDTGEDSKRAQADIRRAQQLTETAQAIAQVFAKIPRQCEPPHSAHVHLSGFYEPEIETLISLCDTTKSPKWHIVHWSALKDQNAGAESTETFCSALKAHRKVKTRLRLHVQRDGSWTGSNTGSTDRIKANATAPTLTLRRLLQAKSDRGLIRAQYPSLQNKDILRLALTIARSLLCLLDSPFLEFPWKVETIYVDELRDGFDATPKLYSFGDLNHFSEAGLKPFERAKSSILHFGLMLWEMFFDGEVQITAEDEEERDDDDDEIRSLFNALNRKVECSGFLDPTCLAIIRNCLDLYCDPRSFDLGLHTLLYRKVVDPLRISLESYQHPWKTQTRSPQQGIDSTPPQLSGQKTGIRKLRDILRRPQLIKNLVTRRPRGDQVYLTTTSESSGPWTDAALLGSSGKIRDSQSWLDEFDAFNASLKALTKEGARTVKVAVLDTGCDIEHEFFCGSGSRQDQRLEGHWFDCLAESDELIDEDPNRHGTAMVALILRLIPDAEIYVIRVARNANELLEAKEDIGNAILHTLQEGWDIDILSMSFGFSDEIPSIRAAILEAERVKAGKILFFAAANNNGMNGDEMFPSFFESVISVRGTRCDGRFESQYDPSPWAHKEGLMYGTLAQNVPCGWTCLVKSGCSVATPIMVAIAASIIRFVNDREDLFSEKARGAIGTRRGILSVFAVMTEKQQGLKRYLAPWQLLGPGPLDIERVREKASSISHALSRLPRQG